MAEQLSAMSKQGTALTKDDLMAFFYCFNPELQANGSTKQINKLCNIYASIIKKIREKQLRGMDFKHFKSQTECSIFTVTADLNAEVNKNNKKECPLCGKQVKEQEIVKHIRDELRDDSDGKIKVKLESKLGIKIKEDKIQAKNAMEIKKEIFRKYKIKVSKQEIINNGRIITGKDKIVGNEVEIRLKKK